MKEADARSQKALRVVGITATAASSGALLLGLGRALATPFKNSLGAPSGAKEERP